MSSSSATHSNGADGQALPMISVVIPAFCEEGNLLRLYEELVQGLASAAVMWELIIVDDGSIDGTWDEIFALHQRDARVKGLRLSRNFGHQYALFAGLAHATGKAVITMDADLQHPPAVIPQLLALWYAGSKIVHTVRVDDQTTPWLKKTTSHMFYRIFSCLSGVELSAGMADFRLLDRQVIDELLQFNEGNLFLRGLIHWVGYPSSKLEFRSGKRFSGESKYNVRKMLKLAWTGVTSFSLVPLRLAIVLGMITSLVSLCALVYSVWAKLSDKTVPGWASMIGIESLLFGILFIMLGIIGEYIGRILEEVRRRPRFLVDERVGFTRPDATFATFQPFIAADRSRF
jgi:glycosyltransferase involved in cell wall biosynthesis